MEEKKISKFSSGINIIQRLNYLWQNCHNFKRQGLYARWNDELDTVWLELARDLEKNEYYDVDLDGKTIYETKNDSKVKEKGFNSQFKEFEDELEKIMPFNDSGSKDFTKPTQDMIDKRDKQYKLLMQKQLFLARLENHVGKGTSWEEEEEDF